MKRGKKEKRTWKGEEKRQKKTKPEKKEKKKEKGKNKTKEEERRSGTPKPRDKKSSPDPLARPGFFGSRASTTSEALRPPSWLCSKVRTRSKSRAMRMSRRNSPSASCARRAGGGVASRQSGLPPGVGRFPGCPGKNRKANAVVLEKDQEKQTRMCPNKSTEGCQGHLLSAKSSNNRQLLGEMETRTTPTNENYKS